MSWLLPRINLLCGNTCWFLPHCWISLTLVTSPPVGVQSIAMSVSMSVCLSASAYRKPEVQLKFTKFSVGLRVIRVRGSVLLWRQWDTLCTSDFVDDVMYSHNGGAYARSEISETGDSLIPWVSLQTMLFGRVRQVAAPVGVSLVNKMFICQLSTSGVRRWTYNMRSLVVRRLFLHGQLCRTCPDVVGDWWVRPELMRSVCSRA